MKKKKKKMKVMIIIIMLILQKEFFKGKIKFSKLKNPKNFLNQKVQKVQKAIIKSIQKQKILLIQLKLI